MVDDWAETGSQAWAVKSMVEECGSQWIGCSVIVGWRLRVVRRAGTGDVAGLVQLARRTASVAPLLMNRR
jgi:adenine phosphoribosyltransferase